MPGNSEVIGRVDFKTETTKSLVCVFSKIANICQVMADTVCIALWRLSVKSVFTLDADI